MSFLAALSTVTGLIGFAMIPVFGTTAGLGIAGLKSTKEVIEVKFTAGRCGLGDACGGHIPSVGLWDLHGGYLGFDHKHGHHIDQGGFRTEHINTLHSSGRPRYIAVAAQKKDAICVSSMAVAYPDGEPVMMVMDPLTVDQCGMPWYQSLETIGHLDLRPRCVWIDGSGKSKNRAAAGSHGNYQDPPAGFSLDIEAFMRYNFSEHNAKQWSDQPELICGHQARFKKWDDMKGRITVPVFAEKPLKYGPDGCDTKDFLAKDWYESERLHNDIRRRSADDADDNDQDEEESDETIAARKELLLHGTLVKGEQSAEALCSSASSYGPDWYSYEEHHYCHMETKTLLPGCSAEVTEECFDADKHEVRHRFCGFGRKCRRGLAGAIPVKTFQRIGMLETQTEWALFPKG